MRQVEQEADGRIVVGVDGSPGSRDALDWAARYAEMTGRAVVIVTAWHLPVMYGTVPAPGIDFETDAAKLLGDARKGAKAEHPEVRFETHLEAGRAADILVHVSRPGDVLVVGSRGHGAFTGMIIGSVSAHCVSHATCPVVVVRG